MKLPFQRFFFLLPLLLTVVLIIFGEALGDLWKEDVKALFQQNKWLLLAFVGLLALVGLLWDRRQNNENTVPETVDKDQYDEAFAEFRKNLLEQYQGRLNSKTGRRLPVNLTAKSTDYGFDPERAKVFLTNQTIESDNIASETDKILDDNGRLLLIGDPGAGKTTILLYAALNILNKISGSSDDSKPSDKWLGLKLPLILNLATWRDGRDFAEWYAQNIAHSYNLSPVFVQELLRRNAVVPFFDGFDEVAEDYRDDCFQKMAAYFGDDKSKQLIVSSRKKEYAAAEADAPVYAEIEVLPLSLAQIKKALSENAQSQVADRALLHALEHDKWLAEALETPFYLNTASFLFGKGQRTLDDFRDKFKADSTEGRQAELVEIFVAEQVPEERDRKYLSFLAGKMEQENFLVFELVKMQPRWSSRWKYRLILTCLCGLASGFIEGFVLGFMYLVEGRQVSGALFQGYYGFVQGLTFGLTGGIAFSLFGSDIYTKDIQSWRLTALIKNWKSISTSRLLYVSLAFYFALTLQLIVISDFEFILSREFLNNSFDFVFMSLVIGISFVIKECGSTTKLLLHIVTPNKRFWNTLRSNHWIILFLPFLMLVFVIVRYPWRGSYLTDLLGWTKFFLTWASTALIISLLMSQFPQHFSLRLVLYLEHKIPLRLVTFLDRMTDQLIFEDNRRSNKKGKKMRGATWRFRHKILQDYFERHSA
jgi:hypothetical protein